MKKYILPIIIIIITTLIFLFPSIVNTINSKQLLSNTEDFTINSFDTEIEVFKNNRISVNEHITVNWNQPGHHSITRILPTWFKNTASNGKTYNRKLEISSLYSPEQFSSEQKVGIDKLKLPIGNAYETTSAGLHTYQIRYNGNFGIDPYKNFDEFIFNAYGDYWGTKIGHPSLKIVFPSQLSNPDIKFYADKERTDDITQYINYSIDGNTLTASVKDNYNLASALTVAVLLPEGYFSGAQNIYGNRALYICLFSIIVAIILYYTWVRFRKDNPKVADTEVYYPPNALDPSQIGFVFKNNKSSKKLTVSLIMSLLIKGYIKIYNTGNNRFNFFNVYLGERKTFRNENNIPLPSDFSYKYESCPIPLSENEKIVYNKLFEKSDVNELYNDSDFYKVFEQIENNLQSNLGKRINDANAKVFQVFAWIFTILSIVLMFVGLYIINDIEPKFQFLYIVGIISSIASVIPSIYIGKRTPYGEQVSSKLKDFKAFIEGIEPEKLNDLIKENPTYYYEIMPYSYVLGLYKSWIDKSANITIPEDVVPSMSSINYLDYYFWEHVSDNIHYPVNVNESVG